MDWSVDPRAAVPPSQQLVAVALDAIASGELATGDRLPSVRVLAAEALVNPNTVAKAYRELELLGAVEGRNGSGVYVTAAGQEVARARRLERFLTQPFFTTGSLTGNEGKRVSIADTLYGCEAIMTTSHFEDDETDYYMIGSLRDLDKAR